jgi:hypothetical protein
MRRGVPPSLLDEFIRQRIRDVLSARTYWTDLVVRGALAVPNAYTTGTVSVNPGSPLVVGDGTNAFPVSDVVSQVIPSGIFETGNQEVFPSEMTGITDNSILLVDSSGTPEVVAVNRTGPTSFWAVFSQPHNQGCTITQSSLAGRQFRMGATSPVLDVVAVQDANTLIISQPWGGVSNSGQQYQVLQMYYTVVSNIRKFGDVVDRQTGFPILTNQSLAWANAQDPQRTGSGDPIALIDIGASRNGQALYELWPSQTSARQIDYSVYTDWPELVEDNDRLPWFIDPQIFFHGALADAYNYRTGKDDYLFNPRLAESYEKRFLAGLEKAKNADDSKMQSDYDAPVPFGFGGGPGSLYAQCHIGSIGDFAAYL